MGLKALAAGKDSPRQPRRLDTDGHIPRAWFRRMIWNPALHALNRLRSECLGYWASVGW
jgi:hypothetical protein